MCYIDPTWIPTAEPRTTTLPSTSIVLSSITNSLSSSTIINTTSSERVTISSLDSISALNSDNMWSTGDGESSGTLISGVSGALAGILVLLALAVGLALVWIQLKCRRKAVAIASSDLREFSNGMYEEGRS